MKSSNIGGQAVMEGIMMRSGERNAYLRAWRAKNRDKVRAANSAYWERKAANKNSSTTDSIGKEAGDNERTN